MKKNISLLATVFILSACGGGGTSDPVLSITSSAYKEGATIPLVNACAGLGGQDISPDYTWANPPLGTSSYAIIMDDEISPCGTGANACKHWGLFNIPSSTTTISEDLDITTIAGAVEGSNYIPTIDYTGPCPSSLHTYNTTVYALNSSMPTITTGAAPTRSQFSAAYSANILKSATISGKFQ